MKNSHFDINITGISEKNGWFGVKFISVSKKATVDFTLYLLIASEQCKVVFLCLPWLKGSHVYMVSVESECVRVPLTASVYRSRWDPLALTQWNVIK